MNFEVVDSVEGHFFAAALIGLRGLFLMPLNKSQDFIGCHFCGQCLFCVVASA